MMKIKSRPKASLGIKKKDNRWWQVFQITNTANPSITGLNPPCRTQPPTNPPMTVCRDNNIMVSFPTPP